MIHQTQAQFNQKINRFKNHLQHNHSKKKKNKFYFFFITNIIFSLKHKDQSPLYQLVFENDHIIEEEEILSIINKDYIEEEETDTKLMNKMGLCDNLTPIYSIKQ